MTVTLVWMFGGGSILRFIPHFGKYFDFLRLKIKKLVQNVNVGIIN